MAQADTLPSLQDQSTPSRGAGSAGLFGAMPSVLQGRQLGLIVAIAASLGLVVGIFLWAQQPSYSTMFSELAEDERARIVEALQAGDRDYRVEPRSGAIQVPSGQVHETRLYLAGEGLPRGQGMGYEMLQQDQRFGTSQFMESARFQRAMENELARSIASLGAVEGARVHLAMPRETVFIRENASPTASVVVRLATGRRLSDGQVSAIVHLVASSVPSMTEDGVTVVDERGNLLTRGEDANDMGLSSRQFDYQQLVERTYARRIEELLTPMLGEGRVKAQVSAQIDFSRQESTQEVFDPEGVLRSEQISEDRDRRMGMEGGVPGALTNQPPGAGQIVEEQQEGEDGEAPPMRLSNSAIRNFEVGKTIRHTQHGQGNIDRLTVAVLVDEPTVTGADGESVREAMSEQELNRLSGLVRDAVGFSEARGDSINIISAAFQDVPVEEFVSEEVPFWQQPWAMELVRWLIAAMVVLALIGFVVRPLVNGLLTANRRDNEEREQQLRLSAERQQNEQLALSGAGGSAGQLGYSTPQSDGSHQARIDAAREMINQDPALAANTVKKWLNDGEG